MKIKQMLSLTLVASLFTPVYGMENGANAKKDIDTVLEALKKQKITQWQILSSSKTLPPELQREVVQSLMHNNDLAKNILPNAIVKAFEKSVGDTGSLIKSPDYLFYFIIDDNHTVNSFTRDKNTLLNVKTIQKKTDGWEVYSMATSRDNTYIVTNCGETTATLWNLKTGKKTELSGHKGKVFSVTFSPDNNYVATGSKDGTAKIWDVSTGKCIHTLDEHKGAIFHVEFSSDSNYIATGSEDKTAKMWEMKTGTCKYTVGGHQNAVVSVTIRENFLITGSKEKISFWDITTGNHSHDDQYNQGYRATESSLADLECSITGIIHNIIQPLKTSILQKLPELKIYLNNLDPSSAYLPAQLDLSSAYLLTQIESAHKNKCRLKLQPTQQKIFEQFIGKIKKQCGEEIAKIVKTELEKHCIQYQQTSCTII